MHSQGLWVYRKCFETEIIMLPISVEAGGVTLVGTVAQCEIIYNIIYIFLL